MKINKRKHRLGRESNIAGWLFVLPFVIGFIFLYGRPVYQSFIYSLNRISVGENGLVLEPIGFENYKYLMKSDAAFVKQLLTQLAGMAVKVLVIMFFSMFLALLLSDKFPGRLLFRAVLFMPVIFGAGAILNLFNAQDGATDELQQTTNTFVVLSASGSGFVKEIISSFGVLTPVIQAFTEYATNVFNLLWDCGIQIILFIIGLQTIPAYLYEVAEMEGATKWETFWKITFPLLTPSILLCLTYSLIDYFNSTTNPIVRIIDTNMNNRIDYACAQSWAYSLLVFVIILIVNGLLSRKVVSMD